ncbi:protein TAR1 [Sesamum angolense]|uniref:Protein TAR1 n=1 Tax=Sesamum angolense TaxID=2727404 RepID=A0AAE1X420_9LAMI|nr:protein TAR1 [Sesamum angolense]
MLTRTLLRRSRSVGVAPLGGMRPSASLRLTGFTRPLTRTHVRLLGPCFQDGSNGEPAGQRRERAQLPRHAQGARCPPRSGRRRSAGISTARALAAASIRAGPRPEPIGGPALAVPHPTGRIAGPHPLPSRQFQALFDSLSKSFSSFPRGTCSLSVSRPYLALDGIYPDWAAFPNNPTRRQRLVVGRVRARRGSHPLRRPFPGDLARSAPLRTLLQTTIRTAKPPDSQVGYSRFTSQQKIQPIRHVPLSLKQDNEIGKVDLRKVNLEEFLLLDQENEHHLEVLACAPILSTGSDHAPVDGP